MPNMNMWTFYQNVMSLWIFMGGNTIMVAYGKWISGFIPYIPWMLYIGYVLCNAMCYVHAISHVHVYVLCNEDITKFIWIHIALMWDTCNTVYECIMIADVQMQPLLHFTIASSREKLFFITLRTKQYNPDVRHNAINIYKCFKANFRDCLVSIHKILYIWSRYYHIKSFILAILKLFSSILSKKHHIFSVFMICVILLYANVHK